MNLKTIKEIQSKYESDLDALEKLQFEKFCKEIQDFPDNFFITDNGKIEVLRKKSDATSVDTQKPESLNNYTFSVFDDLYLDLKHYIRYKRRMGRTVPKQEEKKKLDQQISINIQEIREKT